MQLPDDLGMYYFQNRHQSRVSLRVRQPRDKQDKSIYCLLPPQAFYPEGRIREDEAEVSVITIHSFLRVRRC